MGETAETTMQACPDDSNFVRSCLGQPAGDSLGVHSEGMNGLAHKMGMEYVIYNAIPVNCSSLAWLHGHKNLLIVHTMRPFS